MEYDFLECFKKLSGISHKVDSEKAAAEKIADICKGKDAKLLALAGLPESIVAEIKANCSDMDVISEPYDSKALPGTIDKVDVGVTAIAFAMAQSGTMVEVTTNDATRLVSGLPRTHIGILYEKDIVNEYHDGAARVREAAKENGENLVISFISGPSRTGDIELILSLGVHGPAEAHAIVIAS